MAQGLTTLDNIVREACLEVDDNGMHNYQKFLMWGLECTQDINMDTVSSIKTVVLTSNAIATIPFPQDFVNWVKVGVKSGDRVKVLTINDRLTTHHDLDTSGSEVNNNNYQANYAIGDLSGEHGLYGYWFWNVYHDGAMSGAIYGYGNGTQGDGEFKIDRENRRFQLASDLVDCDILLEYVSNGLNAGGGTMIDEIARKTVKLYILWKHFARNKTYSQGDAMIAKDEYYNERRMLGRRSSNLSTEDILAVVRKSYKLTPKT